MKKTIATITLAFVMTFGATATFAGGGIIIGDGNSGTSCADTKEGIIIGDLLEFFGIIIGDTASQPCTGSTEGIIIGD